MDKNMESGELDIVDLGAASVETKGGPFGSAEFFQQFGQTGLSED
jgi:hypothetical protein